MSGSDELLNPPPREKLRALYRSMVTMREFEDRLYNLFLTETMPGTMHQYTGEEAVAAGVCAALRPDDYITSTHRGHGHCLAKGADVQRMMAEFLGKEPGYCRGRGGSMHIADVDSGNLGANGVVGGGVPVAAGVGLSIKMRKSGQVILCFFH